MQFGYDESTVSNIVQSGAERRVEPVVGAEFLQEQPAWRVFHLTTALLQECYKDKAGGDRR